jgi:hypothetical protein
MMHLGDSNHGEFQFSTTHYPSASVDVEHPMIMFLGKPFLCIYQTMPCEHFKNCIILYTMYIYIIIYIIYYIIYKYQHTCFASWLNNHQNSISEQQHPDTPRETSGFVFVHWGLKIKNFHRFGQWSKKTSGIVSKKYHLATWLVGKSLNYWWRLLRKSSNWQVDFPARHVRLLECKSM